MTATPTLTVNNLGFRDLQFLSMYNCVDRRMSVNIVVLCGVVWYGLIWVTMMDIKEG